MLFKLRQADNYHLLCVDSGCRLLRPRVPKTLFPKPGVLHFLAARVSRLPHSNVHRKSQSRDCMLLTHLFSLCELRVYSNSMT